MGSDAWVAVCSAAGGCITASAAGRLILDDHMVLGLVTLVAGGLVPLAAMFARKGIFEKVRIIANADRKDWRE